MTQKAARFHSPGEKSGRGEYQVRNWLGWHHHLALSLLAAWFLVGEAKRGKKADAGVDGAAGAGGSGADLPEGVPVRYRGVECSRAEPLVGTQRVGAAVPLQGT